MVGCTEQVAGWIYPAGPGVEDNDHLPLLGCLPVGCSSSLILLWLPVAYGCAGLAGLRCAAQPPGAGGAWLLTEGQVCRPKCVCSGPRLKRLGLPGEALLWRQRPWRQGLTSPCQASVCIMLVTTPLPKQVRWPNPKSRSKELEATLRQSVAQSLMARW